MVEYEVSINLKAIDFLNSRVGKRGTKLLFEIGQLGKNPFKDPDFVDQGKEGDLNGILSDEHVILYYVDHAVKQVRVVEVNYADEI